MPDLLQTVKTFGLSEFYLALSVSDKTDLARYSRYLSCDPQPKAGCSPACEGCFIAANGAQFLWATAANAIPDRKHDFAERLLAYALSMAEDPEDLAWIHANLAQLNYDRDQTDLAAGPKTIFHCRELLRLGFMQPWARRIIAELDKSGRQ